MKWLSLLIGLSILGFGVNKYYLEPQAEAKRIAEAPPPPPPPPPPEEEAAPPPVLDPAALEKIRLSTKDSNPSVRWEAIQFLISAGVKEADNFLFEMLQRDTEPDLRLRAVTVLRERPGPRVSSALVRALKDSEPEVRLAVLEALSQRAETDAAQNVSDLVGDSDERVRLAAIRTLNTLNGKRQQKIREAAERSAQAQKEYEEKLRQYEEAKKKVGAQK
ncbi:MAG: HEAT repeat domain-containing protein [Elusimicrobia bacterium]|nr:HEAT repeat domain-containing protein [Elusimicrobiota bacterium]